MKKNILIAIMGSIVVLAAILIIKKPALDEEMPAIAVFSTLSHPALDAVRQGFIERLNEKMPEVLVIDYNAEGSMQQANTIAHQIGQKNNIIGIFAIGTLAAQSMAQIEQTKPIVLAAVSDPKSILVPDQKNVCGLSDNIEASFQIETIKKVLPAVKSISLLYSSGEVNSLFMVKNLEVEGQKARLKMTEVGVNEPQQILSAAMTACSKSDAILIPLDNMLVASMPLIVKATKDLPCAVITSNESPIHDGATLAFGVDYQKSGQKAAEMFDDLIINKMSPESIGFINPEKLDLFLNQLIAKKKALLVGDKANLVLVNK